MKAFPFIAPRQSIILLRVAVSLFLMAHGLIRVYLGTVGGFGEFLNSKGFFIGVALAWAITVFEIVGGATMALGYYVKWIAAVFMIELTMGIFLVHLPNGWFVVGATPGGMEYSALLLLVSIVIAAHHHVIAAGQLNSSRCLFFHRLCDQSHSPGLSRIAFSTSLI
jgi:putative oxidoreductase